MKNAFVVDTNVPVVSNGQSNQANPKCVTKCLEAMEKVRDGIIVIDDSYLILNEYRKNLRMSGEPGPGDAFMKWVFDNQYHSERCEQVEITFRSDDPTDIEQFPVAPELNKFDRSDRKFVAVALGSQHSPTVLNAVDADWWEHRKALADQGVGIKFLCGSLK